MTEHDRIVNSFASLHMPITRQSLEIGRDYIQKLLPEQAPVIAELDVLLSRILAELLEAEAPDRIIIPLSAGLDSRALLGAVLRLVPRSRILCVTVGEPSNREVVGARRICRAQSIEHHRIDASGFVWNLDDCIRTTGRIFKDHGIFRETEFILFDQIAGLCRPGDIILSGYLGDAVSGGNMIRGDVTTRDGSFDMFLQRNRSKPDITLDPETLEMIRAFGDAHFAHVLKTGYRNISQFELLDIGLRQPLRIRGVSVIGDARVICPFEDPRWLSFWFNHELADRIGQKRYKHALRTSYPAIFSLPDDKAGVPPKPLYARAWNRITRKLARALPQTTAGDSERGDPRRLESKARMVSTLLSNLAERGHLAGWDIAAISAQYLENPSVANTRVTNALATAEANLAAGNLKASGIAARA